MSNNIDLRRKSVLIVECDSAKLVSQSLSVGRQIFDVLKVLFRSNPIDIVETTTKAQLLYKFGEFAEKKRKFQNIIIIGHSDENGLEMFCNSGKKPWTTVANWFEKFQPHSIYLIACRAGRWLPCSSFFNGIDSLKVIYGSPVVADKNQAWFVTLVTLYILGTRKPDKQILSFGQLINFLLTKGVVFRRGRSEFEKDGGSEGVKWTLVEPFIEKIKKAINQVK
jgi:hypothetical protein